MLRRVTSVIDVSALPRDVQNKLTAEDMDVYYGSLHAIKGASLKMAGQVVTALIGPSGCGKSTFLRALNRMHDLTPGARVTGKIVFDDTDIYAPDTDPIDIRNRIGMVFQRPNPFAKTIYDNVVYGPTITGQRNKAKLDEICERIATPSRSLGRGQGSSEEFGPFDSQADSSSVCASRAYWPSNPK